MLFRLVNAEYDSHTERAYVEFRAPDNDGDEIIVSTIFTFRSSFGRGGAVLIHRSPLGSARPYNPS
jgi:hypothetical protein